MEDVNSGSEAVLSDIETAADGALTNNFSEIIHSFMRGRKKAGRASLNMRSLAKRVGIEYESFRKMVNRQRPVKERDFVISVCAAVGMNARETSAALQAYSPDMSGLLRKNKTRDEIIAEMLDGRPEGSSADEISRLLLMNGFHGLILPLDTYRDVTAPVMVLKKGTSCDFEFSYQDYPEKFMSFEYSPENYRIRSMMLVRRMEDTREFFLTYINGIMSIQDTGCSFPEGRFGCKDPNDAGEFRDCFLQLRDMEFYKRRFMSQYLLDTRNYIERYFVRVEGGRLHVCLERYNYAVPELNEYYMMEYIGGKLRFSVSKKSRFMSKRLNAEDYYKYYSDPVPEEKEFYDSLSGIENIKAPENRLSPDFRRLRRSAYRYLGKKILEIIDGLRNGETVVDDPDDLSGGRYDVCRIYGVFDNFKCSYDEAEVVPGADAAEFRYGRKKIQITVEDLVRAFQLGFDNFDSICRVKAERGSIDGVLPDIDQDTIIVRSKECINGT